MIVYFSGTGNSKYVAERIAIALNDKAVSVEEHDGEIHLAKGERLGIVTPVYWLGLSVMAREFIRKMNLTADGDNYIFTVGTYGLIGGHVGKDAAKELGRKGIQQDAAFSVRMPEIWTPIFNAGNKAKNQKLIQKAEKSLAKVILQILHKTKGSYIGVPLPYFLHPLFNGLINLERHTKRFHVEDNCIGCGLCAQKCPAHAIEMREGKPTWVKEQCAICLRCLHHCPKFAIHYRPGLTHSHGQYKNPNTRV